MTSTKVEFAVQMTCEKCKAAVLNSLSNIDGINNVEVSLEKSSVVVDTTLPYTVVQKEIEKTGKKTVFKGIGDKKFSAVAMIGPNAGYSSNGINGVIRFVQGPDGCIVDGAIDGLTPGPHGLHIHECGDISDGCKSVGQHYNPHNTNHGGPEDNISNRHAGDLGNVVADKNGKAVFRLLDQVIKVQEIFGRSLVITESEDDLGKTDKRDSKIDGSSGNKIACGVIARSPGLFQNEKKICACDGVTIWDENTGLKKSTQNESKASDAKCEVF